MTKSSLSLVQRQTVEIIEALGFGVIEGLVIRDGLPYYVPEPVVIQEIKLNSEPPEEPVYNRANLTLKKEFESLFDRVGRLQDAVVDIEVRHGLPFKLVVKRRYRGSL